MNFTPAQTAIIDRIVRRAKFRICREVTRGVIPATITFFDDCDEFVDANALLLDHNGEFDDDLYAEEEDTMWDMLRESEYQVSAWIKTGGHTRHPMDTTPAE